MLADELRRSIDQLNDAEDSLRTLTLEALAEGDHHVARSLGIEANRLNRVLGTMTRCIIVLEGGLKTNLTTTTEGAT